VYEEKLPGLELVRIGLERRKEQFLLQGPTTVSSDGGEREGG
jgi:hypothetical protein